MTTRVLMFKKMESEDKTEYGNFYLSQQAEININESDIGDVFQLIYTTAITKIFRKRFRLDY